MKPLKFPPNTVTCLCVLGSIDNRQMFIPRNGKEELARSGLDTAGGTFEICSNGLIYTIRSNIYETYKAEGDKRIQEFRRRFKAYGRAALRGEHIMDRRAIFELVKIGNENRVKILLDKFYTYDMTLEGWNKS